MIGPINLYRFEKAEEKEKINLFDEKFERKGNSFFWNDRYLGHISKDGKRFITKRSQEHFFIKYKGFGFNKKLVEILEKEGVEKVIIYYTRKDGGETLYITTPKTIKEKGILIKEEGFEEQYVLPVEFFEIKK